MRLKGWRYRAASNAAMIEHAFQPWPTLPPTVVRSPGCQSSPAKPIFRNPEPLAQYLGRLYKGTAAYGVCRLASAPHKLPARSGEQAQTILEQTWGECQPAEAADRIRVQPAQWSRQHLHTNAGRRRQQHSRGDRLTSPSAWRFASTRKTVPCPFHGRLGPRSFTTGPPGRYVPYPRRVLKETTKKAVPSSTRPGLRETRTRQSV